jgi:hypothetical protein
MLDERTSTTASVVERSPSGQLLSQTQEPVGSIEHVAPHAAPAPRLPGLPPAATATVDSGIVARDAAAASSDAGHATPDASHVAQDAAHDAADAGHDAADAAHDAPDAAHTTPDAARGMPDVWRPW